ncbi:MAG: hypothetical protein ACXAC7_08840, partial [Candidatus Hodarchaeales archaeon]
IDIVDSQTGLSAVIDQIVSPAKAINYLEFGWQEIGYNHYSPIFGHNPESPLVMYGAPPDTGPITVTGTQTVVGTETVTGAGGTSVITETQTSPFGDVFTILSAFFTIAVIGLVYKRKSKR